MSTVKRVHLSCLNGFILSIRLHVFASDALACAALLMISVP
jgi:hypothetical protein